MICTRYSLKPSEVAKDNIKDYQFNVLVAVTALQAEAKRNEKAAKAGGHRGK